MFLPRRHPLSSFLKLQVEDLIPYCSGREPKPGLNDSEQTFARSLCDQYRSRGLSEKQAFWVGKLLDRAERQPQKEPEATNVGSVKGVVDLLDTAKKHLKHPAVIVRANGRDLRLSIAGPTARVPGSINVCSTGSFGDRDWFGRVTTEGQFEPCQRYDAETQTAVAAALQAMASDPAKAAAEYGHLTGVCCFCNTPLTDGRSTEVGYGPTCAKHYGLPWGGKRATKTPELREAA